MNRISFLILFLLTMSLKSPCQNIENNKNSFVITGNLQGRDTGIITLLYPFDGHWIKDTSFLDKGNFRFSGSISEPSFCALAGSKKNGNYINFFLEASEQQISVEENKFGEMSMIGSFTQKQADSLKKETKNIYSEAQSLNQESAKLKTILQTTTDSTTRSKIENLISGLNGQITARNQKISILTTHFIAEHPDSYASPTYLYGEMVSNRLSGDSVKILYDRFSEKIKNSRSCGLILDEFGRRELNKAAPVFTARDIKNKNISLVDLKGRYVLLNFWASWCLPCIDKIPDLMTLFRKYHSTGFDIINISIDRKKEDWMRAVKKYSIQDFYNVLVNAEIEKKYTNVWRPIPSEILINNEGTIIWNSVNQSSGSLEKILENYFSKPH